MRRIALSTAIFITLILASQSFAQTDYLHCYDVPTSYDDVVGVLSSTGKPGDTVWVPIYVKSDSIIAGFNIIIRYDNTFLTPIMDPASPTELLYQRVGRFALAPGEADYLHLGPSYNPADSGGIVALWPANPVVTDPLPIGEGPIALMAFEISPFTRQGDQAQFWMHAVNEMLLIDDTVFPPDTIFADCRTSNFAVEVDGGANFTTLFPSWWFGTLTVDTSYFGVPKLDYFGTNKRAIVQGDSTNLGWIVNGADSLVLQPGNIVFHRSPYSYNVSPTTTTTYTLTAYGPAGTSQKSQLINVTLPGENQYPVVSELSFSTVTVGEVLHYYVETYDPDGTIPILTTTTLPGDATLISYSGQAYEVRWQPTPADVGDHPITFYATDATDPSLVDSLQRTIRVLSTNLPPVLIGDFTVVDTIYESDVYQFGFQATDTNGTIPYIEASLTGSDTLATNMFFTDIANGTGVLVFAPDLFQGNDHPTMYHLEFIARDADDPTLTAQAPTKHIYVFNNNSGTETPELQFPNGAGPFTVMEDSVLQFEVDGYNTNGDLAELSSSALPANATFTLVPGLTVPNRRRFIFAPVDPQAGTYDITFYAVNNGLVDSQVVTITVLEGNAAPFIFIPPLQPDLIYEDEELYLLVLTFDPDSTIPTLSAFLDGADTLATNMTLVDSGNGSAVLTFMPNRLQGGDPIPVFYHVRFTATDVAYPYMTTYSPPYTIRVRDNFATCCLGRRGDPNYDGGGYGETNVIDLTAIIGYLVAGRSLACAEEADVDASGFIDMNDVTMMVAYLFLQEPRFAMCY